MKELVNFEHFKIIKEAEQKLDAYLDSLMEGSINEAAPKAKTRLGAALGSPVKFIKIKNNAKKYQQTLVQRALNNVDFEKKKQAAGGEISKEKADTLKAANAAKNQALTDKAAAIGDRMTQLATSPGLQKVKTLAISKAKVAAAEIALKAADAEETKQLKVQIKKLNQQAADAEAAIKDYEKEGGDQQQATPQEMPASAQPKVKDTKDKKKDGTETPAKDGKDKKKDGTETPTEDGNAEKIAAIDTKINKLKDDKKAKEDSLGSKKHPDVLAIERQIKAEEVSKAELGGNAEEIAAAKSALKVAQDDLKAAVNDEEEGGDPTAKLEKDIADYDKNIEDEMNRVAQLKKDLEQAKRDTKTGRGSDAQVVKIQKDIDDSNQDIGEMKKRKADAKKQLDSLQKESVSHKLDESVSQKFRRLMESVNEAYSGKFKVGDKVYMDGSQTIPSDIQWEIRRITKKDEPTFYMFSVLNPNRTVQIIGDEKLKIWDKKDQGKKVDGKGDYFKGYF